MITKEKVEIYRKFKGDIDGWSRCGSPGPVTYEEWWWLDQMFSKINNIKNVPVSESFKNKTETELIENTDSEETRILINQILHEL